MSDAAAAKPAAKAAAAPVPAKKLPGRVDAKEEENKEEPAAAAEGNDEEPVEPPKPKWEFFCYWNNFRVNYIVIF